MRALTSNLFVFALAASASWTARADEDEGPTFELADDRLIIRNQSGEQSVPLGCLPRSFTSVGTRAYALCSPNTVVIVVSSPTPHIVERRALREYVVSLTLVEGVVSARARSGVRPLDDFDTTANGEPPPAPRPLSLHSPSYESGAPAPVHEPEVRGFEMRLSGTLAPGLDSPAGVGAFIQGAFLYRFAAIPLSLGAYGTLGAGTGPFDPGSRDGGPTGGDVQVATGEAVASVDARYVAFGLGAGVALMDHGYEVEPVVALRARFGEIDEFQILLHMAFATGGFTAAGIFGGAIEFRVARTWWLGADAELGNERYGRFMLDVRHRFMGDGHYGTLDLVMGIGLAYVHSSAAIVATGLEDSCTQNTFTTPAGDITCAGTNTDYLGPAASLGLLWRP